MQGQLPAAEGTGAISGVVFDGATNRPLAGVVVGLSSAVLNSAANGRFGSQSVLTDEKGRFIFTKLPASESYGLSASKIGYTLDSRAGRRVALADRQWISDAKITMWRLGSLSGTITDEAGEPVVGTFVRVLTEVFVSGLPQLAGGPATRTDDRGVYRIAGLPAGKYLVLVPSVQTSVPAETSDMTLSNRTPQSVAAEEAGGYSSPPRNDRTLSTDGKNLLFLGNYLTPPASINGRVMSYPITFYPGARSPRDATVVDLKQGETRTGIDLQLRPVPVVRVCGIVQGPPEAEGPGMTLRLMPSGAESLANGSEVATALVGKDGVFTFLNVPSGEYTILAGRSQMEYQVRESGSSISYPALPTPPAAAGGSMGSGAVASGSASTQYSYRSSSGSQTHSGRVPISVGARDLTDVVVPLRRGVSITGKIVSEAPPAAAGSGRGPSGFPVYAEPADGSAALGMPSGRITTEGANQTFTIDGLQPGKYSLRFLALTGGRLKSISLDGKDITNVPIDTSAGQDITGIVVTTTDKTIKVTGYARDVQNQLMTHGNVIVFPAEQDQWTGYGFTPKRIVSATVVNNGSFTVNSLLPGNYLAIAVDESLASAWQDPKFLAAAASLATRFSIDWGGTASVDLTLRSVPGFIKLP